jgi:thiazole synthase
VRMAGAMRKAIEAGRDAYLAGRMPKKLYSAAPSSPTTGLIE